jgi:DNA gyrase subunit A
MARIKGPDFPNGALIGPQGHRGRLPHRPRPGDHAGGHRGRGGQQNRTCLVVTQLPHMCNPDNLATKIAELVKDGRLHRDRRHPRRHLGRTGQRLVIVLKRDAQPRVVMNNLYKHTPLQDTFGCNMLALVDGVPRTLRRSTSSSGYWLRHQMQVIERRTQYRLEAGVEGPPGAAWSRRSTCWTRSSR